MCVFCTSMCACVRACVCLCVCVCVVNACVWRVGREGVKLSGGGVLCLCRPGVTQSRFISYRHFGPRALFFAPTPPPPPNLPPLLPSLLSKFRGQVQTILSQFHVSNLINPRNTVPEMSLIERTEVQIFLLWGGRGRGKCLGDGQTPFVYIIYAAPIINFWCLFSNLKPAQRMHTAQWPHFYILYIFYT